MSYLRFQTAGNTGTNRPCQAIFSTAGRTSFAGRIICRRTLPQFCWALGGAGHQAADNLVADIRSSPEICPVHQLIRGQSAGVQLSDETGATVACRMRVGALRYEAVRRNRKIYGKRLSTHVDVVVWIHRNRVGKCGRVGYSAARNLLCEKPWEPARRPTVASPRRSPTVGSTELGNAAWKVFRRIARIRSQLPPEWRPVGERPPHTRVSWRVFGAPPMHATWSILASLSP